MPVLVYGTDQRADPNPVWSRESQGAQLMSKFGIHVPEGVAAQTIADVEAAAKAMADEKGEVGRGVGNSVPCLLKGSGAAGTQWACEAGCLMAAARMMSSAQRAVRQGHMRMCCGRSAKCAQPLSTPWACAQVVIKSQILAGGRGLGKFKNGLQGGVHIVPASKAVEISKKMLGEILITKQTGDSEASKPAACSNLKAAAAWLC